VAGSEDEKTPEVSYVCGKNTSIQSCPMIEMEAMNHNNGNKEEYLEIDWFVQFEKMN
jgi:hypothetical protein